jgi:hypothetical protein
MPRYSVLLNGRGVELKAQGGEPERGGFFVPCVVQATGEQAAREQAVATLRSHPKFLGFRCWPGEKTADGRPTIAVESVERLPWWKRRTIGISTGFILYPGPDEPE